MGRASMIIIFMAGLENGHNVLFADTFYWIALFDRYDSAHERALTLRLSESPRKSSLSTKSWLSA